LIPPSHATHFPSNVEFGDSVKRDPERQTHYSYIVSRYFEYSLQCLYTINLNSISQKLVQKIHELIHEVVQIEHEPLNVGGNIKREILQFVLLL